jgi:hypothetical protein
MDRWAHQVLALKHECASSSPEGDIDIPSLYHPTHFSFNQTVRQGSYHTSFGSGLL